MKIYVQSKKEYDTDAMMVNIFKDIDTICNSTLGTKETKEALRVSLIAMILNSIDLCEIDSSIKGKIKRYYKLCNGER